MGKKLTPENIKRMQELEAQVSFRYHTPKGAQTRNHACDVFCVHTKRLWVTSERTGKEYADFQEACAEALELAASTPRPIGATQAGGDPEVEALRKQLEESSERIKALEKAAQSGVSRKPTAQTAPA